MNFCLFITAVLSTSFALQGSDKDTGFHFVGGAVSPCFMCKSLIDLVQSKITENLPKVNKIATNKKKSVHLNHRMFTGTN